MGIEYNSGLRSGRVSTSLDVAWKASTSSITGLKPRPLCYHQKNLHQCGSCGMCYSPAAKLGRSVAEPEAVVVVSTESRHYGRGCRCSAGGADYSDERHRRPLHHKTYSRILFL